MQAVEIRWPLGGRPLVSADDGFACIDGHDRLLLRGPLVTRRPGHTTSVLTLDFSGGVLASSGSGEVRWWRLATGEERSRKTRLSMTAAALSAGQLYFLDDGVQRWDIEADQVEPFAAAKTGSWLRACPSALLVVDRQVRRVDRARKKVNIFPVKRPLAAGFLDDDTAWVCSSEGGGRVFLFHPGERAPFAALDAGNAISTWAASPGRAQLVVSSPTLGAQRLVDASSSPRLVPLDTPADVLACDDDGRVVAARGPSARLFDAGGRPVDDFSMSDRIHAAALAGPQVALAFGGGFTAGQIVTRGWP